MGILSHKHIARGQHGCLCDARSQRRSEQGFSLVEVMIALTVFSLSLAALGAMQLVAINFNASAQLATLAQETMEKLMVLSYSDTYLRDETPVGNPTTYIAYIDLVGDTSNPPTACTSSMCEATPPSVYRYKVQWQVDVDSPSASIKTVDVTVTGRRGTRERTYALSFAKSRIGSL
jgi:prepilin-type N-terminal cleavage/methylation domain-containing protein